MRYLIIALVLLQGCGEPCDCTYVTYERKGAGEWRETYASSWNVDDYCKVGVLDESTYTDFNGVKTYGKTQIECR